MRTVVFFMWLIASVSVNCSEKSTFESFILVRRAEGIIQPGLGQVRKEKRKKRKENFCMLLELREIWFGQ